MTCANDSLKFPGWRLDKTDTQQSIETKITAKGEELGTQSRLPSVVSKYFGFMGSDQPR